MYSDSFFQVLLQVQKVLEKCSPPSFLFLTYLVLLFFNSKLASSRRKMIVTDLALSWLAYPGKWLILYTIHFWLQYNFSPERKNKNHIKVG